MAQGPLLPVPMENTAKMQKRRYESKSTEDLSLATLRKKAKELDQTTTTSSFEKYFQKNKTQFIPNLNRPRSRTSSQNSLIDIDIDKEDENEHTATSDFIKPKRTAKRTKITEKAGASTSNTFIPLGMHSNEEIDKLKNSSKVTSDGKKSNPGSQHTVQHNNDNNVFRAKSRPPPIHVYEASMKNIIKIFNDAKINEEDFWVRQINNYISVNPVKLEVYKQIKELLDKNKQQYYTYTPKEEKKVTLVLKGVISEYNEHDVKNFISNKKLQNVNIEKVTKLQFDKNDDNRFFFLVHLSPDSKPAALTKLRYILNQPVRWEKIRKKAVFQCRRCQRIGHASRNCHFNFRCVKCGKDHGPIKEGNVCELQNAELKDIFCINCGQKGHPASYAQCPYLNTALDLKSQSQSVKRQIRFDKYKKINNYVNNERSYANTTRLNIENFPALPHRGNHNQENYWNDTPNPNLFQREEATQFDNYNPNNQDNSNNFSQIEKMMINFKNSLTEALKEQFNTLSKQVTENSRRIDYILSQFDY